MLALKGHVLTVSLDPTTFVSLEELALRAQRQDTLGGNCQKREHALIDVSQECVTDFALRRERHIE